MECEYCYGPLEEGEFGTTCLECGNIEYDLKYDLSLTEDNTLKLFMAHINKVGDCKCTLTKVYYYNSEYIGYTINVVQPDSGGGIIKNTSFNECIADLFGELGPETKNRFGDTCSIYKNSI